AIPNTPVSINQGVIGAIFSESMTAQQKTAASQLLETLGLVKEVPESLLETVGTVAGCSPAFVDIFLEALADAAVREGLGRELAYEIVAQMLKGSA
ncbi:pyrroline-5-carboxylate reductase family protein, partial [Enterococcus faecalis]